MSPKYDVMFLEEELGALEGMAEDLGVPEEQVAGLVVRFKAKECCTRCWDKNCEGRKEAQRLSLDFPGNSDILDLALANGWQLPPGEMKELALDRQSKEGWQPDESLKSEEYSWQRVRKVLLDAVVENLDDGVRFKKLLAPLIGGMSHDGSLEKQMLAVAAESVVVELCLVLSSSIGGVDKKLIEAMGARFIDKEVCSNCPKGDSCETRKKFRQSGETADGGAEDILDFLIREKLPIPSIMTDAAAVRVAAKQILQS